MSSRLPIRIAQILERTPPNSFSPHRLSQLHSLLITSGLQFRRPSARLSLLNLYLSNPSTVPEATALSRQIQEPTKWNLMIRHVSAHSPLKALSLFREMRAAMSYCQGDPFVFASLIKACNKARAIREGKSVHCYVIRLGLDCNVNVLNSLISFYMGSANFMVYADHLFDEMSERSVVSLNSMISGHVKRGDLEAGLGLFLGSFGSDVRPNYVTFVVLISGCVEYGEGRTGMALHCCCCKIGLVRKTEICNVLIDLYAKLGCIDDAVRVFGELQGKDLVSWNSMLWGYVNSGGGAQAFLFFRKMRAEEVCIDGVSFSCLLSICEELCVGTMIHAYVKVIGLECEVSVRTALIDMYGKCGEVESARKLFDELPKKNIEYWNAMIHAYIEDGLPWEALKLVNQIKFQDLEPDEVTLLGLIMACRATGEIRQGILAHSIVEKNEVFKESTVLGNALIDMYAKCGSMEKARGVFDGILWKDVVSWTSMIVGYAINGEGDKSLATFELMCAEKFVPNSVTFIGVLSACDHAGLIDEGRILYDTMSGVYCIKPWIEHCGCIVDMLGRAGRIEDAQRFIQNMPMAPNALIWRMLVNACRVHGLINHGLNLVTGITELNTPHDPADHVASSNMYAEAGRWGDVVSHRSFMAAQKATKTAGKSSSITQLNNTSPTK